MKYIKILLVLLFSATILSCEDEQRDRAAETKKIEKQNDSIVKALAKNWKFTIPVPTGKVQQQMGNWGEWEQLKSELVQKPAGDLGTYRQKTKDLVRKAELARNTIPTAFRKPQVASRFDVLVTKIKSLHTFVSVDPVSPKKVFEIMGSINYEAASIFNQFDEMIRIKEIPKEIGEDEMLRALDTVRLANPDAQPQPPASAAPQSRQSPPDNKLRRSGLLKLKN
ncbi:hypothetical protein [uncultured Flavobacterium sp.]|uniref:hypothetical protein n=1 Tax=uncultured Flavobacterium sp. TaxID=165435 RepID=UPI0025F81E3A|nr:hypothetical protein [uncultured Flavobacterium sp.]